MPELSRHDPDDGVTVLVYANPPADDAGIAPELPFPEAIANDDSIQETGHPVRFPVDPADGRPRPQQLKVARAGAKQFDPFGAISPS